MSEFPVAIVTGAAQGLGAAITKVLLKNGYKVCVGDIQEEKGRQFVKEQQGLYGAQNVVFSVCDVTKEEDYEEIFDFTLKELQRIDLIVNNVGIFDEHSTWKTIAVNLMGPFIGCQLAFKYMGKSNGGKGGMVINTAFLAGFLPHHGFEACCAIKQGVIDFTRFYGRIHHLEKDGIVFAALCPPFADKSLLGKLSSPSLVPGLNTSSAQIVMTPEYIAEGVMKLLEDRINGSTLVVTRDYGYQYVELQEEFQIFKDFK